MRQTIWIAAALLVVYIAAYYSLVGVKIGHDGYMSDPATRRPGYNVFYDNQDGQEAATAFFWPMHEIDLRLRPRYWNYQPLED